MVFRFLNSLPFLREKMLQTHWTMVGLFVLFASYDIYTWVTCYGLN